MLLALYPSKKALKEAVGKPLRHEETSIFGAEYTPNGSFCVANRPHITGMGKEFFAQVEMRDGLIASVK